MEDGTDTDTYSVIDIVSGSPDICVIKNAFQI
jgi:hypothetical protein